MKFKCTFLFEIDINDTVEREINCGGKAMH